MRTRTSVPDELGCTFSLDNGVSLQRLVCHWVACFRKPERSDDASADVVAVQTLRKSRQPRSVWWEARSVSVCTWPAECRDELLAVCRAIVDKLRGPATTDQTCQGGPVHRGLLSLSDICGPCVRRMVEELSLDYKCLDLHSAPCETDGKILYSCM